MSRAVVWSFVPRYPLLRAPAVRLTPVVCCCRRRDGSLFAWPTVSAPAEPLHANLGSGLVDMRFDPTVRDAVFVGCLDGAVRHVMVERLGSAEVDAFAPVVGMHDAGVRVLAPAAPGVMASADFNKGVKFWDVRAPKPVVDFRLGDKVHGMDCDGGRLVIATGGEKCSVLVYDLRKLCEAEYGFGGAPEPQRRKKSPMMFQTRVVRCFAEGKGFFLGGVDGRCGVQYHPGADDGKNRRGEAACFVFKCHRRNDVIFCVNDVACHPGNPDVMTTVGGDGSHFHWNKKKRTKLAGLKSQLPQSLTSCSLNTDASYLAYSCSYDWAQGYKQPEKCWQNMVIVETVADGTWTK